MSIRIPFFGSRTTSSTRLAAWIILIAGVIGTADSFYLVLQYLAAITTQGEPTPCSPSSIVNCTKTVQGVWGHLLAAPNPLFGMMWYSGWILYGAARVLGTEFSKPSRIFVGSILDLGLIFSYILYLASIFSLRGVCPFCLLSTTLSTLIALALCVDETSYRNTLLTPLTKKLIGLFQLFSVAVFVIGLPVFLGIFIPKLLNPVEALTHWSFPVMILLVLLMAATHVWAYRIMRKN